MSKQEIESLFMQRTLQTSIGLDLMITIENDNFSFSKILSSKEIADIIKQVVKDSNRPLFSKLATGNIPNNSNIQKITESQCSPNCWCKQQ